MTWRGRSLQSEAYLDSGAFYSIFKMSVAAELGLDDVSRARKRMFMVADGSFIPAKLVKLPIEIAGRRRIAVAFSDRLNIGFNLLGRKDVFEGFDEIIFREARREIELRWG
jgi:hypothetical protein